MIRFHRLILFIIAALFIHGCTPIIAEFEVQAYKNATDLKARSLGIIDVSNEPYSKHQTNAEKLLTDINAAYEFVAGISGNQISARQWDIMRDKNRALMGGYLVYWKTNKTVGDFFKDQSRIQISKAFDYIICLEANKKQATSCANPNVAVVQQ